MLRSAFLRERSLALTCAATVVLLALDYAQGSGGDRDADVPRLRIKDFSASVERHGPRKMVCVARS